MGAMAIVAIAAMAAFNLNINADNENVSALTLENTEVLAWGEGSNWLCPNGCKYNGQGCYCYQWFPKSKEGNLD